MPALEFNPAIRRRVEALGHASPCIREQDEQSLQREFADAHELESALNQVCREHHWTRESDVLADIQDLLAVAAEQHGSIDEAYLKLVIDYAVALNVPRKHALRLAVQEIARGKHPIAKSTLASDWFQAIRARYEGA